jgi:hypothetical protein
MLALLCPHGALVSASWLITSRFHSCSQLTHSDELAAAGYDIAGLAQQMRSVDSALQAAPNSRGSTSLAGTALDALVGQLHVTGVVCTGLPVEVSCNSPACSSLAGDTELGAVSGNSNMCWGCFVARYCSPDCWKQHKPAGH